MMTEIEKYIKKILDLIYKKDEFEEILFDLSMFADHIGYNSIVKGSGDELEKRKRLVESQIDSIESSVLKDFFKELLKKEDLWLFDPGHFKIFVAELNDQAEKALFFSLTTAVELKKEDIKRLSERLSAKTERKVVIHLTVDKSLLGGAIIKKDNYIMDYSLKTKMNNLCNQWKKSIQKAG